MLAESQCGLVCSTCDFKERVNCPTCLVMEKPFWGNGEQCPIKACTTEKGLIHCGQCADIPCDLLTTMAYEEENGDQGQRITQCKEWWAQSLKKEIMEYALTKPGATYDYKEEWGWDRLQVGDKLFVALAWMKGERLITTIKLAPEHGDLLRRGYPEKIIPGYYTNKEHWNSIFLDLPWEITFFKPLIDEAYEIVFKSLTKKKQKEILEQK